MTSNLDASSRCHDYERRKGFRLEKLEQLDLENASERKTGVHRLYVGQTGVRLMSDRRWFEAAFLVSDDGECCVHAKHLLFDFQGGRIGSPGLLRFKNFNAKIFEAIRDKLCSFVL